jgi:hypothetical protein
MAPRPVLPFYPKPDQLHDLIEAQGQLKTHQAYRSMKGSVDTYEHTMAHSCASWYYTYLSPSPLLPSYIPVAGPVD